MKKIKLISRALFLSILMFTACGKAANNNNNNQQQPTTTDESRSKIQVVFLLDATGSMAGLIETAKQKIWSIASGFTQTQADTDIEIGMIFYRDRGDDFITKQIPLGTPMDDLYEVLMSMQAMGGGDGPESVNQALWEAVSQMQWDSDESTYRAVFLVGDYPPHMDYRDDVKYPESCAEANKRHITINTILMGDEPEAYQIWKEIAQSTNGEFVQTDMNVNNITVSTPYDREITRLQSELDKDRIYYGKSKELNEKKKAQSEKIMSVDAATNARRAEYNLSKAGKESYYGSYELINEIQSGKKLSEIAREDLPAELQKMSEKELKEYVEKSIKKRSELEEEIKSLNIQRQEYINTEIEKMEAEEVESSFDEVIFKAVQSQADEKGIKLEGKAKR